MSSAVDAHDDGHTRMHEPCEFTRVSRDLQNGGLELLCFHQGCRWCGVEGGVEGVSRGCGELEGCGGN